MNKYTVTGLIVVLVIIVLPITAAIAFSDGGDSQNENSSASVSIPEGFIENAQTGSSQINANVENYIPVQGKLTNAAGTPLNGDYSITFRLYDVDTGGVALCDDTNWVHVVNGLFTSEIWGECQDKIQGEQIYLGIEVGTDGEMTPRQPIYAVPYAWSLRPNAVVSGTVNSAAILHVENFSETGRALRAYARSSTGANYGVVGAAVSPDGYGGYFYNNNGTGLLVSSDTGTPLKVTGTGVIQSSALSYVWISGNGVRPFHQTDSTIIDMDTIGGAFVKPGPGGGTKVVMLPVTLPGVFYGQNITVTGLDLYYQCKTSTDFISAVLLRRQTGVCETASCYSSILQDTGASYGCTTATGCSHHWTLANNNTLSPTMGSLYLAIEMTFSSETSWVEIGGARLTLKHE